MKYGNKILAILLTAVCLIGVLPLIVFAKTETVYIPPNVAITNQIRYSASSKKYMAAGAGEATLTVPLPIDKTAQVHIELSLGVNIQNRLFYLDQDFNYITHADITETYIEAIDLTLDQTSAASFVVLNIGYSNDVARNLIIYINGVAAEMQKGEYKLATLERYEQIEVPDEPQEDDIVNSVLELWQRILTENIVLIDGFYYALTKPIALIIGIPCCIALIGILLSLIGGKKR